MFLDVRTMREYRAGHVPASAHAPFWLVMLRGIGTIARKDEEIVVYCELGPRAWMAQTALRLRGYRRVTLLEGHMRGWRSSGKPLER